MAIRVSIIVAIAENGVIGNSEGGHLGMPWHIKSEMAYFRKTTLGHPIVMGRKSFEALGGKPLPNRPSIIVTRDVSYRPEGVTVAHTLDEAIETAKKRAAANGKEEIFICGGAEVYRQALPVTDKFYLTEIHLKPVGDVVFPSFDRSEWTEIKREFHRAQEGETADYTITVLNRK